MPDNSKSAPMSLKKTHVSIGSSIPGEISSEHASYEDFSSWRLSDNAIAEIEKLESNIRIAELQSGRIIVG